MKTITYNTFINNYKKFQKLKSMRITKFNINNYNTVHIYYYNNNVYCRDVNNNLYYKFNNLDEFKKFIIDNKDINYKIIDNNNIVNFYSLDNPDFNYNHFIFDCSRESFI